MQLPLGGRGNGEARVFLVAYIISFATVSESDRCTRTDWQPPTQGCTAVAYLRPKSSRGFGSVPLRHDEPLSTRINCVIYPMIFLNDNLSPAHFLYSLLRE